MRLNRRPSPGELGRVIAALSLAWLLVPALCEAAEPLAEIDGLLSFATEQRERARRGEAADVAVDAKALDRLARKPAKALLRDVPLADGSVETFAVEAFDVFTDDAKIVEFDGQTERRIAFPDVAVFAGAGVSDPSRWIVLSVGREGSLRAIVQQDTSVVSVVAPTVPGGRRYQMVGGDGLARSAAPPLCDGVLVPDAASLGSEPARRSASGARAASDKMLEVEILIDAGNLLYTGPMGSSSSATSTYIAQLVGAVAAIYRRDLRIAPVIEYLVIWTTPEPFDGADSATQLDAYRNYNLFNRSEVPRDLAHYVNYHTGHGGRAVLGSVCDAFFDCAVSNVFAESSFPIAGYAWDVMVVSHEIGHNLGSHHTHCYSPPIDHCYNLEGGCYSGPVEPSVGETMSYCHFSAGMEMGFRDRVGETIRANVESLLCLAPKVEVCGDGFLDVGEECDDGDSDDGDCCSSACLLLSSSSTGCEDGSFCTDDYACADSTCYYQPHICDDAEVCTLDYCDDTLDSCQSVDRPNSCDDGQYCTLFEACVDGACDGGVPRGCDDGSACTADLCDEGTDSCSSAAVPPSMTCDAAGVGQLGIKIAGAKSLKWKWGKGAAIDPAQVGNPVLDLDNFYSLCLYDETEQLLSSYAAYPGNLRWKSVPNGSFKYRDSPQYSGPVGLTGATLKPGIAMKSKLQAKAKSTGLTLATMPFVASSLRVQLRRSNAVDCWETVFDAPFDLNTPTQFKAKSTP